MKLRIPILGLSKEGSLRVVDQKVIEIRTPHIKAWLDGTSNLFPSNGVGKLRRYPRPQAKK
jgi:hypothetical protein